MAGEMIENAIKSGRLETGETSRKGNFQRKKEEVQQISYHNQPNYQNNSYRPYHGRNQYQVTPLTNQPNFQSSNNTTTFNATQTQNRNQNTNRTPQFDPIPMSYSQLYNQLFERRLIAPVFAQPRQPPYPKWYDANLKCEYHNKAAGHSIDNCIAFKNKVQNMINVGALKFEKKGGPNVNANPLPQHDDGKVNAVEKEGFIKKDIKEVRTPMDVVLKALLKVGWVNVEEMDAMVDSEMYCQYHGRHEGHTVQWCPDFRKMVQKLMDEGRIEFYVGNDKLTIAPVEEEGKIEPFIIYYSDDEESVQGNVQPQLVIETPGPFAYQSDQAVPWDYSYNATFTMAQESDTANVSGVGGMTRSGRCYTPEMLSQARAEKSKVVEEKEREQKEGNEADTDMAMKRSVTDNEATEFLKFIKHSEYSVVDQLKKMPAKISILQLILDSKPHRDVLLKMLNQAYVPKNVSVDKLDHLVGNVVSDNFISFSDDEIPPNGRGSTKALHITASFKGLMLSRILIDNGSSLNIMPMSTLSRLPVDMMHMKRSHLVVRAFDGTRREVMGHIELSIQIGPCTYEIDFQVMDIRPSYNCLLGRPWIHSAGAVPSSLHQKLKFVLDGRLISVSGEEDIIAATSSSAPYIDVPDDAVECSFRAFEIVNATFVTEGKKMPQPSLSNNTKMGLNQTVGKGCRAGFGLGKNLQGMNRAIKADLKHNRAGLGYKATHWDKKKALEEKGKQKLAQLEGRDEPMHVPPLSESFRSAGFIHTEAQGEGQSILYTTHRIGELSINATDEAEESVESIEFRPWPPGFKNWQELELPVIYHDNKM